MNETPVLVPCGGVHMLGVVTNPPAPEATPLQDLGLVVVVGGPQVRVGSHRQFLLLARRVAQAGFATLRFDLRGMGDSEGLFPGFEAVDEDIAAAIGALQQQVPQVRRVALFGLCDGASAAMLYAARQRDPRVAGLCLLNPWARSEATQAQTQVRHYYRDRLLSAEFWKKLVTGRVAVGTSASELFGAFARIVRPRKAPESGAIQGNDSSHFLALQKKALHKFPGHIALLLSGQDYTAKEFLSWARAAGVALPPDGPAGAQDGRRQRFDFADADHTFSSAAWRADVEACVLTWMHAVARDAAQAAGPATMPP